jgi:hypothetical protein
MAESLDIAKWVVETFGKYGGLFLLTSIGLYVDMRIERRENRADAKEMTKVVTLYHDTMIREGKAPDQNPPARK